MQEGAPLSLQNYHDTPGAHDRSSMKRAASTFDRQERSFLRFRRESRLSNDNKINLIVSYDLIIHKQNLNKQIFLA